MDLPLGVSRELRSNFLKRKWETTPKQATMKSSAQAYQWSAISFRQARLTDAIYHLWDNFFDGGIIDASWEIVLQERKDDETRKCPIIEIWVLASTIRQHCQCTSKYKTWTLCCSWSFFSQQNWQGSSKSTVIGPKYQFVTRSLWPSCILWVSLALYLLLSTFVQAL